jgi:SpoVK/Ycf46/Vps4 family AAA+-type ATPase
VYREALRELCARKDPIVVSEVIRLFSEPVTLNSSSALYRIFESFERIEPLHFLVSRAVLDQDPIIGSSAISALRRIPEYTRSADLLSIVRESVQRRGYAEITKIVTAEIAKLISSHDDCTALSLLCMLHALAKDDRHSPRLKKQISNLRDFRTPIAVLATHHPEASQEAEKLLDEVIKGLTPTLSDYYHGPGMEDLNEAVEKFKLLCDDPTILNGVEGNEGMKSGVLLIGEPGLGKTSLVEALEGELGVKCFKIAPVSEDLASPAQLLASARRTIEEVKKLAQTGKPCMFFIDEAESLMRSRKDPLSSIEQKTLTCYLLQEIDEIRRKFPRVFLVAATNYIDEVDEGMLRQGRFDIHVFYGKPDSHMRKNIIVGTLTKANIDVSFSAKELEVLVNATDGLKPLSIKQTIIDLHRFGSLLAKKRGETFEFGFETLNAAYEKEQRRLKRSEDALEAMKKRARHSRDYDRLSAP